MTYYRRVGEVPPKRHMMHRDAGGSRLPEELMGEEGFRGASSLLYHRHSPSAIVGVEAVTVPRSELTANEPLLPWHLRAGKLDGGADLVTGRRVLLGNADVTLCWVSADGDSPLYRDAVGDEVVYLQSGRATLESVFGRLRVGAGDYVVIPTSTTHRWVVEGGEPVEALVIESAGHVGIPSRYRTATGQLREGAPYSERDLRGPDEPLLADGDEVPVIVRTRAGWSRHTHAHHPFDVVGWDGCCYPFAFSIEDFEPIVGRVHQPPPVHQTFEGPGFVVCSFVPRPYDFGPDAVKVPYHHANVDSDEVLFYSRGDFMSRAGAGIGPASLTLHPAGFVHGPQPGSVEASMGAAGTEETAVMVDTFRPLLVSADARAVAASEYPWSWAR
ncbi:MAG TPA: cupin domain-containing protein [Acidimicrobiales bacterium]|nr:cupin domain-containing protein [Acidimicrobiales bacterium]